MYTYNIIEDKKKSHVLQNKIMALYNYIFK